VAHTQETNYWGVIFYRKSALQNERGSLLKEGDLGTSPLELSLTMQNFRIRERNPVEGEGEEQNEAMGSKLDGSRNEYSL